MVAVEANAKINLTLDILGTRPDGYHEVEMVMQSVGLSDTIRLERSASGIELSSGSEELPADESNLAWKAARLFLDANEIRAGVRIVVEKRIPIAAGLAGGSTDAAGTLVGMNRLFDTALSAEALCTLGEKIGSDVPFCIMGGTMLASGRGEKLRRLPSIPPAWIVLAKPPVAVSTAWAYRRFDALAEVVHPDTRAALRAISDGSLEGVAASLGNVLEGVTAEAHEEISAYKRILLQSGAMGALMSGSGPTVFALTRTEPEARRAAEALSRERPEAAVFAVPVTGENVL
ncbi:MAG: 4-(cytidine 5'-diphospho)-2-C-methyl-D-erythritol kinase, partial [Oscillospiraceae bacterium]|nr:4-(cytidine 5'-diphospho)-2-C-methyl-D-erythritol kinase [Oscillospiraceae bacterium]